MNRSRTVRVVVGFDFSSQAEMALERAIWMLGGLEDPEIHLVAALGGPGVEDRSLGSYNRLPDEELRRRVIAVAEARRAAAEATSIHFFVHTRASDAAAAILEVAAEVRAEMILVGTHSKKGVRRLLLGSVAERLVRQASCPVLVMRELTYGLEAGPQLEAACDSCLAIRAETHGERWWCGAHDHAPPYRSPLRSRAPRSLEASRRAAWPLI